MYINQGKRRKETKEMIENRNVNIGNELPEEYTESENHKENAKYGWYRYNVRFALSVYEENTLVKYNIFHTRLLINHPEIDRKYLYDILSVKKKRANRSKMYGENPFLIVNNMLFFNSCQSSILIFRKYRHWHFPSYLFEKSIQARSCSVY